VHPGASGQACLTQQLTRAEVGVTQQAPGHGGQQPRAGAAAKCVPAARQAREPGPLQAAHAAPVGYLRDAFILQLSKRHCSVSLLCLSSEPGGHLKGRSAQEAHVCAGMPAVRRRVCMTGVDGPALRTSCNPTTLHDSGWLPTLCEALCRGQRAARARAPCGAACGAEGCRGQRRRCCGRPARPGRASAAAPVGAPAARARPTAAPAGGRIRRRAPSCPQHARRLPVQGVAAGTPAGHLTGKRVSFYATTAT